MAKGSYQVIFSGKIIEHADLDMVKANVARTFSMPPDRIEKLFSGRRLVLKKDLDQATAERYRITLQRAGALCEIEDTAASTPITEKPVQPVPSVHPAAPEIAAQTQPPVTQADESGMSMAEAGIILAESAPVPDANIDTGDIDMAEAGIILAESTLVPDANIDTGDIDMAEAGIILAESASVPDANIDTGDIDMAEVGITLTEPEEFLAAEFDLGDMSMDEAGAQLVEPTKVAPADIDTSQLSLD